MPEKRYLGMNVLEAARQRIAWVFDTFPRIYCSLSGGKDSTVMTHLVMVEARRRGRKVGLLFIDMEAQYRATIEHVQTMFDLYADSIEPYWVALPLDLRNAVSAYESQWVCWQPGREADWVRQPPAQAITDQGYFPFYRPYQEGQEAEDFGDLVIDFGHWYGQGKLTACLVGIRTAESLNRWRTIAGHGTKFEGRNWTNYVGETLWNVYPIYDWQTTDIWTFHGSTGLPYNRIYDLMYRAGLTLHQMRLCQPYGDDQRRGLWLFHILEPDTWARIVARVNGANAGALYAQEPGNILGNIKITKPEGHTWQSFAKLLLESLPPKTREHFTNKIAVFLHWWALRGYPDGIPDYEDPRLEAGTDGERRPSWRRICKVLLRYDYWCRGLSFSRTGAGDAYSKYLKIMRKRRQSWGIFP